MILNDNSLLGCYRNHEVSTIGKPYLHSDDPALIPEINYFVNLASGGIQASSDAGNMSWLPIFKAAKVWL